MSQQQIALFDVTDAPDPRVCHIDLHSYDQVIVAFSGGRDSVCAVLRLLEQGVPRSKIELWHHRVDGYDQGEGGDKRVFDWLVTDSYVKAFAEAFGLALFFSGKQGGIAGEMYRTDARTRPVAFETPDGLMTSGGDRGKLSTRRMFPAVSADLGRRFCSSYVKISVGAAAIAAQTRFCHSRTLFVSGERAEESANRATYKMLEPHRTDRRNGKMARHVDHGRIVLDYTEQQVWDCLKRWGVRPHPAYEAGFGRCSCAFCVFSSKNQLATLRAIDPEGFEVIADMERDLSHTMKNGAAVHEVADLGTAYEAATPERAAVLMSSDYNLPILMEPGDWVLPAGAFGESAGPV